MYYEKNVNGFNGICSLYHLLCAPNILKLTNKDF